MLRSKLFHGPLRALIKLKSQKVPEFPELTVLDRSDQFALLMGDSHYGLGGNVNVHLEARAVHGNIFKVGHTFARFARCILPPDRDQVGA